jgi:hypothetical protein
LLLKTTEKRTDDILSETLSMAWVRRGCRLFLALAFLDKGGAYPSRLTDCRVLAVGGPTVMNQSPATDVWRTITVTRGDSTVLADGGTYIPGESLKFAISNTEDQYIFELNTDAFEGGANDMSCTKARSGSRTIMSTDHPLLNAGVRRGA